MVDQIRKPGVNITQVFEGTPPTPVTATLVPCIVGPAFEVVELTGEDGTASAESQVVTASGPLLYRQLPVDIPVSNYPTPRADSSQMDVLVPEVEVALQRTGDFNILDRNPGTAFLKSVNFATRPGIWISGAHVTNRAEATFIILVDSELSNNAASYVVSGEAGFTAEDLLNKIVTTVPGTAFKAYEWNSIAGFILYSKRFGATASMSLVSASGGSTSQVFFDGSAQVNLTYAGQPIEKLRTEGSGFYAQDNPIATILTSSIVKHSEGAGRITTPAHANVSLADNTSEEIGESNADNASRFACVHLDVNNEVIDIGAVAAVNFINDFALSAATTTSNGDLFTASGPVGQSISDVMVTEVKSDLIKLGVVNTERSTYDAEGNPVVQVYNDFQLNTLKSAMPFAPKNGFFTAQNLTQYSPITGTATVAEHTAVPVAIDVATEAQVGLKGWETADNALYSGLALDLILTINAVSETFTLPFIIGDDAAHIAAWAPVLDNKISVTYVGDTFTFKSAEKGSNVHLSIQGTAGRDAVFAIEATDSGTHGCLNDQGALNADPLTAEDFGTDDLLAGLTGKVLRFSLNQGPTVYEFTATSDAIAPFLTTVNAGMGYDALSYTESGGNATFVLKSYLYGVASMVSPDLNSDGNDHLQFTAGNATIGSANGGVAVGSGRPNPDVFVHEDGAISISGDIMRNTITGNPVSSSTSARVHVAYRALRTDLSPTANNPGIIRISSIDTLNEVFGPISNRNPFALAVYYALLNAGDGVEINAIGVDDISEAEPEGTVASYASAAEFLRSFEVYSIVPLTQDENVIAIFDNHVKDMSDPLLRAERTVISSPTNPTRYNDEVVLSTGETGAESTGVVNQVDLSDSPEAILNGLGIDTSVEIPFALSDLRQLYVHLTIGDASYRYSVSNVSGGRVTFRTTYSSSENGDGFYDTSALPSQFTGADFSLALRGAPLTTAGLLNKTAYAETVRGAAQQYLNRRQIRLYPDTVQSDAVGGINQRIPSYYFASALAGMVANIEPQEPLTRVPMVGFNDVTGPSLDRNHLNIISAGNAVIEPEAEGSNPSLRMQGTTDPSTIESREWSVTRAVDAFSKTLRSQLKSRIGRFNITQAYIDDLTMLVDSNCTAAVANGQFRGAEVIKLEQDVTQPDTILVEIRLEVLYPANYINVTLVV